MIARAPRIKRRINHAKRIWAELDYAQRRSLELQTGVPMDSAKVRARIGRDFDGLNRLRAA
jgi:hypothetical protein